MKHLFLLLWLVLGAIGCAGSSRELVGEDFEDGGAVVEERLREAFVPEDEPRQAPRVGELLEGVDLAGAWANPGGFVVTKMTFEPREDGAYAVTFTAGGCLSTWTLHRTATYAGSVVTLDRPVKEYTPAMYTRLYTVRYNGAEYLVPSDHVADFEEGAGDPGRVEMWLLKRQP